MDKAEAVMTIISDARSTRSSTASAKRTVTALKVLDLDDSEIIRVLGYLDYCDENGKPYSAKVKRVWK